MLCQEEKQNTLIALTRLQMCGQTSGVYFGFQAGDGWKWDAFEVWGWVAAIWAASGSGCDHHACLGT